MILRLHHCAMVCVFSVPRKTGWTAGCVYCPRHAEPRQGIVRLIGPDLKNLQSMTVRLRVAATQRGQWLGLV